MFVYKKILTCAVLLVTISVRAQKIRPFKTGDRIAFVGNSITDGGHYHSYIWLYYMTHFPQERITCFNAGIGGDQISQIYDRFNDDVLSKKPNIITLTWGMNDTRYFEWHRPDAASYMTHAIDTSYEIYGKLEKLLKARRDIEKILIGTSPYDETTKSNMQNLFPGKAKLLSEVVDYQRQSAKKNGWGFVDFYRPMREIEIREQAKDSMFSLTPNDRIHPDNDGHMVMAYLFLKAQGLAGKPVAEVSVDAASGSIGKQVNCVVSNVSVRGSSLSFDYLARSLPYPLDSVARGWGNKNGQAGALQYVPFEQEFNQEILSVKDLKPGSYLLKIDGQPIGSWPAEAFADGINLAEQYRTPQYQQALQISALNEERWDIERRFRMYQWMEWDFLRDKHLLYADNTEAMDSIRKYAPSNPFVNGNMDNFSKARFGSIREVWQQEMDLIINKIYTINKPKKHRIDVTPQTSED